MVVGMGLGSEVVERECWWMLEGLEVGEVVEEGGDFQLELRASVVVVEALEVQTLRSCFESSAVEIDDLPIRVGGTRARRCARSHHYPPGWCGLLAVMDHPSAARCPWLVRAVVPCRRFRGCAYPDAYVLVAPAHTSLLFPWLSQAPVPALRLSLLLPSA